MSAWESDPLPVAGVSVVTVTRPPDERPCGGEDEGGAVCTAPEDGRAVPAPDARFRMAVTDLLVAPVRTAFLCVAAATVVAAVLVVWLT
ncbi:hypothetical protein [Streptomyces sp. NBC_00306]|uniref:hypothetical protein n=1 Tax=Streptomyces sp. NBC_00306 TaxID=2975708 RepID=UPI002E2E7953|nr:hypothetical protein [Streptomyces sp. NBC_00306]